MTDWLKKYGADSMRLMRKHAAPLLPGGLGRPLEQYMGELQELFLECRPPRLALLGRQGAGKTSAVNAIFGREALPLSRPGRRPAPRWETAGAGEGRIETLEARIPDPRGEAGGLRPALRRALEAQPPDVLCFIAAAPEAARDLAPEAAALEAVRDALADLQDAPPPLLLLINQADRLPPEALDTPPFDDEEKLDNIEAAVAEIEAGLGAAGAAAPEAAIAMSARLVIENGQVIHDLRWRHEAFVRRLLEHLPRTTHLELARAAGMRALQREMAKKIGQASATLAGVVASTPIPMADLPLITSMQSAMITAIGYISGRRMDKRALAEFVAALGLNIGVGFAARHAARQLLKFVPGGGMVMSSVIAYATTAALAQAATAYFIDGQSAAAARAVFEREKAEEEARRRKAGNGAGTPAH